MIRVILLIVRVVNLFLSVNFHMAARKMSHIYMYCCFFNLVIFSM